MKETKGLRNTHYKLNTKNFKQDSIFDKKNYISHSIPVVIENILYVFFIFILTKVTNPNSNDTVPNIRFIYIYVY